MGLGELEIRVLERRIEIWENGPEQGELSGCGETGGFFEGAHTEEAP